MLQPNAAAAAGASGETRAFQCSSSPRGSRDPPTPPALTVRQVQISRARQTLPTAAAAATVSASTNTPSCSTAPSWHTFDPTARAFETITIPSSDEEPEEERAPAAEAKLKAKQVQLSMHRFLTHSNGRPHPPHTPSPTAPGAPTTSTGPLHAAAVRPMRRSVPMPTPAIDLSTLSLHDTPLHLPSSTSPYTHTPPPPSLRLFTLDLETTGFRNRLSPPRLLELAVVDLLTGASFSSLINPERRFRSSVHGIKGPAVKAMPTAHVVIQRMVDFVEGACRGGAGGGQGVQADTPVLLAHNGARFDFPVLQDECARCGLQLPPHWLTLDTLHLATALGLKQRIGGGGLGQEALTQHFNLPRPSEQHRALPDAQCLVDLYQALTQEAAAVAAAAPGPGSQGNRAKGNSQQQQPPLQQQQLPAAPQPAPAPLSCLELSLRWPKLLIPLSLSKSLGPGPGGGAEGSEAEAAAEEALQALLGGVLEQLPEHSFVEVEEFEEGVGEGSFGPEAAAAAAQRQQAMQFYQIWGPGGGGSGGGRARVCLLLRGLCLAVPLGGAYAYKEGSQRPKWTLSLTAAAPGGRGEGEGEAAQQLQRVKACLETLVKRVLGPQAPVGRPAPHLKVDLRAEVHSSRPVSASGYASAPCTSPTLHWALLTGITSKRTGKQIKPKLQQVAPQGPAAAAAPGGQQPAPASPQQQQAEGGSFEQRLEAAKAENLRAVNKALPRGQAMDVLLCPELVWSANGAGGVKLTALHIFLQ